MSITLSKVETKELVKSRHALYSNPNNHCLYIVNESDPSTNVTVYDPKLLYFYSSAYLCSKIMSEGTRLEAGTTLTITQE